MAGDNLYAILAGIRKALPDVSDAAWDTLLRMIGEAAAGERVYVPTRKKRSHLEALAAADEQATADDLAKLLGVSVRRVRQIKCLLRRPRG